MSVNPLRKLQEIDFDLKRLVLGEPIPEDARNRFRLEKTGARGKRSQLQSVVSDVGPVSIVLMNIAIFLLCFYTLSKLCYLDSTKGIITYIADSTFAQRFFTTNS